MTNSRWKIFSAVLACFTGIFCMGAWQYETAAPTPDSRIRQLYFAVNPYATKESSQFWIRVTEHPEKQNLAFINGAFYAFDSGPSQSGPWKQIMMVHLDDPEPIPTNNVIFVDSKIAYVFLYDKLAVTTDAGLSWSSWELAQGNEKWKPKKAIIRNVLLSTNGTGTMTIEVFASGEEITLHTQDFGRSWLE
jgi:hypothetical protein